MQTAIEQAKEVFPKVELPTDQLLYIPRFKDTPLKGFQDYKGQGYVANFGARSYVFLGQLISEQVGRHYALNPLQLSYNLVHSNTQRGKNFKEMNRSFWFPNAEVSKKTKKGTVVFPQPKVVEKQGELVYDGESKKVEINEDDVIETLANAGLFKEADHRVYRGSIDFDDNGESSVGSCWFRAGGRFYASSGRPSFRIDGVLAAFRLVGHEAELLKPSAQVQVEEECLMELESKEKKYGKH